MSDHVKQLVGALEELLHECEQGIATSPHARIEARSALTAAKAGGWVAVPGAVYEDDGVSLIRRGTEDERCRTRGSVRLYAHLPNPPKEQSARGLGSLDDGA